jgi:hypothetical protein
MKTPLHLLIEIVKWIRSHVELLFWVIALFILFCLPENTTDTSLCIFSLFGFGHCPGCGIGHAMHYALRLKFTLSVHHHPLGIFGVLIIFIRIKQLLNTKKYTNETKLN